MEDIPASTGAPVQAIDKYLFQSHIYSGLINEYITHVLSPTQMFVNFTNVFFWKSTSASASGVHTFVLHAPDNIHLSDLNLVYEIEITNPTAAAIETHVPLHLALLLWKNFEIRLGQGGQKRTKINDLQKVVQLKKFMNLTTEHMHKTNKYTIGPASKLTIDKQSTLKFSFATPLSLLDSSGVCGIFKVFPSNTLIEIQIEPITNFDKVLGPELNVEIMPNIQITGRVTKIKEELRVKDNRAIQVFLAILKNELHSQGIPYDESELSKASPEYLTSKLKEANVDRLQHMPLVSVLSTQTHKYNIQEITHLLHQGPEIPARSLATFTQTIQSNAVLPKAVLFLVTFDARPFDRKVGLVFPACVQRLQVRVNSQDPINFNLDTAAKIVFETRKALNNHTSFSDTDYENLFGLVGVCTDINGTMDYISEIRMATITAEVHFSNPLSIASTYKVHVFRIYDQVFSLTMSGIADFLMNTL